jgi:hypothetical protein
MPGHLSTSNTVSHEPLINKSLFHYLAEASKAAEQYSEIWNNMCKITHLYGSLENHELTEMSCVFKLQTSVIYSDLSVILKMSKGDNCIIKTGDTFTKHDVDSLYILSLCFNEVYIYKPLTTSAISSTKYVVCKDFKMIVSDHLREAFNGGKYIVYNRRINNNFMNAVIEANSVLGQQQLEAINNTITLIEQGKKKEKIEALRRHQTIKCAEWCKRFGEPSSNYHLNYKPSGFGDI